MNKLTVQPPDVNDLTENFRNASIDSSMPQWQEISKMKLSPFDHRGSMLPENASMVSEDSRRPSLLVSVIYPNARPQCE